MGFVSIVILISILALTFLLLLDLSKGKKKEKKPKQKDWVGEEDIVDDFFFIKKINKKEAEFKNFNIFAENNKDNSSNVSFEDEGLENNKTITEFEQEDEEVNYNKKLLQEKIDEINSISEEANEEIVLNQTLEMEGIYMPDEIEEQTTDSSKEDLDQKSSDKSDVIDPERIAKFLEKNKGLFDPDD